MDTYPIEALERNENIDLPPELDLGSVPTDQTERAPIPLSEANAIEWIREHLITGELVVTLRELEAEWNWPKSNVSRFLDRISGTQFQVTRDKTGTHIKAPELKPASHNRPDENDHDDEFSWADAQKAGIVVQPHCSLTAIYWNPAGNIVIRAEQSWSEDQDPFLVLSPAHVPTVIKRLFDMIGRPAGLLDELTDHVPSVGGPRKR
jgi:hypothetical protein